VAPNQLLEPLVGVVMATPRHGGLLGYSWRRRRARGRPAPRRAAGRGGIDPAGWLLGGLARRRRLATCLQLHQTTSHTSRPTGDGLALRSKKLFC
jgi:hypothetical protein